VIAEMKRLWIAFVAVLVVSFAVLGWAGLKIYQEKPPIPEQVMTTDGTLVIRAGQILAGQEVWRAMGGMESGSVWGHGSYVAPDWSADWLHRECVFILDEWSIGEFGTDYETLPGEPRAALKARLKDLMRTNSYDPSTGRLVLDPIRLRAYEYNREHYRKLFAEGDAPSAIPAGAVTDPQKLDQLVAFFFWTSWAASTERPEVAITPESEAYIIFTSGSTGRPKGVLLPHCGIVDRARDVHLRLLGDKQWRLTQFASLSFDASVFELLMMLLTGGCTVPVTREVLLDVEKYQELLLRHKVNFILLPPSYLRLLNRAELPTVELIKTAGEAAYSADALHYSQSKTYVNAYGPTEDSVCSSWYQVDPALVYPLGIPIGQPVIDTEILILDSNLCQVPVGVEGELCVSDAGLALEYINQPELTAAAFVPLPSLWQPT